MKNYCAFFLFLCFASCGTVTEAEDDTLQTIRSDQAQFDKRKWRVRDESDYPYREELLPSILYNDSIRTMSKEEVVDMLGPPDRSNEGFLYYMISQTRLGFWPLKTKTMVVKITGDDRVEWIKVHE